MPGFPQGDPVLSVVIPTHNRSSILQATLPHLSASKLSRPWEILVVANACTDQTVAMVAGVSLADGPSLRLLEDPRPSASVARNRGAGAAIGELLVFLDDDILLEPDALTTILDWYEASDRQSLLVGQVLPLAEHLATPFGAFRRRSDGVVPRDRPPHDVDWFASGVAAAPAATFLGLGGYAEHFPAAGLEDADIAIRTRRAGHSIVFHPGVVGFHNDSTGTTARDYCRRATVHCATAPLLVERFPDNDHPWGRLIEVNRPPVATDPVPVKVEKGLKAAAVAVAADRWMPALADHAPLPGRPRELLYRASVSLAMYAGYQRGLRQAATGQRPAGGTRRQPLAHRLAWRIAESGLRGNSHLVEPLHRLAAPTTGLVQLPDGQILDHDVDDYVSSSIYRGGYEPAERRVFRSLVRRAGLVVDVGANAGIYTLTASRLVGPTGRVIAIEPGPALAHLQAAVGLAGVTNVTIVRRAVGAEKGEAVLHVPSHQSGLASLRTSSDKLDPQVVGLVRLDELDVVPAGEIDVLKIDTEGYEAEVLAGASQWLEAGRVRAILVEASPEFGDVDFVAATAMRHGFTAYRIGYRTGLRHRPELRPVTELDISNEPTQANYLLLRSDLQANRLLR